MSETPKIRVLVVDDHKVVRVGLRAMISHEPDMEVVAEAADGPTALAAHAAHQPDVTLMDLRLPDIGGAELITEIRKRDPKRPLHHPDQLRRRRGRVPGHPGRAPTATC